MEVAEENEEGKEKTSSSEKEREGAAARGVGKAALAGAPRILAVRRFVEKPDAAKAGEFLASGRFLWNAGIFLFKASVLFEELARAAPAVLDAARRALAAQRAGISLHS